MKTIISSFLTIAVATASAASYDINVPNPVSYQNKRLAAGQYTVEVKGEMAVFRKGKSQVLLPVTAEQTPSKNAGTRVNTEGSELREIYVGGSNVKLIFKPAETTVPAGGGGQ